MVSVASVSQHERLRDLITARYLADRCVTASLVDSRGGRDHSVQEDDVWMTLAPGALRMSPGWPREEECRPRRQDVVQDIRPHPDAMPCAVGHRVDPRWSQVGKPLLQPSENHMASMQRSAGCRWCTT